MVRTEEQQKELFHKFMMQGVAEKAALECTAVAVIYEAFFELTCHETNVAAILTLAVANSLAQDD